MTDELQANAKSGLDLKLDVAGARRLADTAVEERVREILGEMMLRLGKPWRRADIDRLFELLQFVADKAGELTDTVEAQRVKLADTQTENARLTKHWKSNRGELSGYTVGEVEFVERQLRKAEAELAEQRTRADENLDSGLHWMKKCQASEAEVAAWTQRFSCKCGTPGTGSYEGPQEDCEVHGELRSELIRQRDSVRGELDRAKQDATVQALNDAADEYDRMRKIGQTPARDLTKDEEDEWWEWSKLVTSEWLRSLAAARSVSTGPAPDQEQQR